MKKAIYTNKNNKYCWKNTDTKIEFSAPSIQAQEEYLPIDDKNSIMYFYYTVKLYHREFDWDDHKQKFVHYWKKVAEKDVFDFPNIESLVSLLEDALSANMTENAEVFRGENGEIYAYRKSFTNFGWFGIDDHYQIDRIYDPKRKNDDIYLYLGVSFSSQSDMSSIGIKTNYVTLKDLEKLLQCAKEFIAYAIKDNNEQCEKMHNDTLNSCKIYNGKLYHYTSCKKDALKNIFIVNDFVDIAELIKNDTLTLNKYRHGKIVKLGKTIDIEYTDYEEQNKKVVSINPKDVIYIYKEIDDEKLTYNIDQVVDDFIGILSKEEKEEFVTSKKHDLLKKYKSVIINRTTMCRDEHNFGKYNNRIEEIDELLLVVIKRIKGKLKNK